MRPIIHVAIAGAVASVLCSSAVAATRITSGMASFSSDQQDPVQLSLESFDRALGSLQSVIVECFDSGRVAIKADNDDPYHAGRAQVRMIRSWMASGPDVTAFADETILSRHSVTLAKDNGDGRVFDASRPDGHNFGILSYSHHLVGPFHPLPLSLYETVGPGSVIFTVTPLLMINDLSFVGPAPQSYQLELQEPVLRVKVKVKYVYHLPEPSSLFLLIGGLPVLLRRRQALR